MKFGRLTWGFAFLGLLAVELYGVIYPPEDTFLYSTDDQLFIGGVVGFIGGALLGMVVWAVWHVLCWVAPNQSNRRRFLTTLGVLATVFGVVAALVAVVTAGSGSGSGSAITERPTSTSIERPKGPPVRAHGAFLVEVGFDPAEIYLVNAAGGRPRLVATRVSGEVSWSPDGTRVLATVPRPGSGHSFHLLSYPVRGGHALNLTPGKGDLYGEARWSPDGTWVAYNVWTYPTPLLEVVPATGGRSHFVEETDSFAWSPDGRRLASYRIAPFEIVAVPVSGGRDVLLAQLNEVQSVIEWGRGGRLLFGVLCPGAEFGCGPPYPTSTHLWTGTTDVEIGFVDDAQFLPDGTVAFLDGRGIGLLRPDNTLRMVGPLPERATSATWSTDGRYLAFASSTGHVYVARADGGGARRLPLNLGRGRKMSVFGWQPHGAGRRS